MTNLQDEHPESPSPPSPAPPMAQRLSALAVVSMVLACMPCPPMSLLGVLLGLMALSRIRHSRGMLRGVGLARMAIVVGIVVSLAGVLLLNVLKEHFERGQEQSISETVHVFLTQAANGNSSGALAQWDLENAPVRVEDIEAFGSALQGRFGSLKSLRVGKVIPATDTSLLQPRLDAWLILEFESGTRNGAGKFILIPEMGSFTLGTKLRSFKIEDPTEPLAIPPEPVEPVEPGTGDEQSPPGPGNA